MSSQNTAKKRKITKLMEDMIIQNNLPKMQGKSVTSTGGSTVVEESASSPQNSVADDNLQQKVLTLPTTKFTMSTSMSAGIAI